MLIVSAGFWEQTEIFIPLKSLKLIDNSFQGEEKQSSIKLSDILVYHRAKNLSREFLPLFNNLVN